MIKFLSIWRFQHNFTLPVPWSNIRAICSKYEFLHFHMILKSINNKSAQIIYMYLLMMLATLASWYMILKTNKCKYSIFSVNLDVCTTTRISTHNFDYKASSHFLKWYLNHCIFSQNEMSGWLQVIKVNVKHPVPVCCLLHDRFFLEVAVACSIAWHPIADLPVAFRDEKRQEDSPDQCRQEHNEHRHGAICNDTTQANWSICDRIFNFELTLKSASHDNWCTGTL